MSFASDTRSEIAREIPRDLCCAKTQLACSLLMTGGISFRGLGRYSVQFITQEAVTARLYYRILKEFFDINCEIQTVRAAAFGGRSQYRLSLPEDVGMRLLQELDLLDSASLFGIRPVPSENSVNYSCCKKAFLRSAFLSGGTLTNPEKSYQLEFPCPNEELATFVSELLTYFGIYAKIACRKVKYVVYLKRSEPITDALRLLGASAATMRYENILIGKEFGNRVNRQLNCDDSNINKVMRAAESQIDDIRLIDSEIGLDKLPRTLQEYAKVRVENPSVSLSALGELLDPPLGKSGVNSRMRRVQDIAEKLRTGDEIDL